MENKGSIISFGNNNFVNVEGLPNHLHSSVLPLVLVKDKMYKLIGTCFVINSRSVLAVTATHNIEEAYGDISSESRNIDESEGVLHIFYFSEREGEHHADLVPVQQIYMEKSFDSAILKARVPVPKGGKAEDTLLKNLALNFDMPEIGDKCLMLGYDKETEWISLEDRKFIEVNLKLKASQGFVEEVIFSGVSATYLNFPCFRTSARCEGGMSGGPVISAKSGNVIGLVCRSFDLCPEDEDPISHVSHTSTLLPICIANDHKDLEKGQNPVFERIKNNNIEADESFNDLEIGRTGLDLRIKFPTDEFMYLRNFYKRDIKIL